MLRLIEYKQLPVTVPAKTLYLFFEEAVSNFEKKRIPKNEFLEILVELIDRQGYTYERLNEPLKSEIDRMISQLWNTQSYDDVDILLWIIINLALEHSYLLAKKALVHPEGIDPKIIQEIREAMDETGGEVEGLYYDFRS